jgi:hypothetical protein
LREYWLGQNRGVERESTEASKRQAGLVKRGGVSPTPLAWGCRIPWHFVPWAESRLRLAQVSKRPELLTVGRSSVEARRRITMRFPVPLTTFHSVRSTEARRWWRVRQVEKWARVERSMARRRSGRAAPETSERYAKLARPNGSEYRIGGYRRKYQPSR